MPDYDDVMPDMTGFMLLNTDPVTGIRTYFRTNEDGTTTICHQQDVEPLIEENVALYNESYGKPMGDWCRIARVPDIIAETSGYGRAVKEGDRKFVAKFLNDSDHRKFRTHKGRL